VVVEALGVEELAEVVAPGVEGAAVLEFLVLVLLKLV
jgi:hypothetical protein